MKASCAHFSRQRSNFNGLQQCLGHDVLLMGACATPQL